MIDIRIVPKRGQTKMLIDYGYIYNQTTVDRNIFTRTSEQTFTLSRQFDNEDESTNSNDEEIQSVSENDDSNSNNDGHISDGDNNEDSNTEDDNKKEQTNMFVQGHIQNEYVHSRSTIRLSIIF